MVVNLGEVHKPKKKLVETVENKNYAMAKERKISIKWRINVLTGEFQNNLDAKGRLIVPSKLKEALGEQFVITKGVERCLLVYPMKSWEVMEETRAGLDFFDPAARKFERYFFGSAETCEVDKQGRVLIPQTLRKFAGIEKEVYTIGTGTKLEIWNKEEYERYMDDNYEPESLSREFSGLGVGKKL